MHTPTGCPGHRKGLGKKPGFTHLIKCVLSTYIILWASLVAQTGKNLPAIRDTGVQSLSWEDALEKEMAAAAAKLLQSCPTLCDPMDGSPPGSPVPGILQARTLEWVAISFSNA